MTSTAAALELLWSWHQRCPTGMATLRRRTEDREATYRMWWDGTRRRIEADEPRQVLVVDGRQWWQETGDMVTVGDGQWFAPPPAADDAVRDFVRNLGWFDIEIRGAVDHAGRHCVDLEARPRRTPVWASRRRHGRT